ncbi:serendipity locus protein alpha isoform X2 [Orussus abietinus]|nr:serendipity locus protein alpha isoform X2 [Orussus abietinus]
MSLEALEKLECLPLKQRFQDCWDYVKEMGLGEGIEDFQNIKELGTSIVEVFGPLQCYRKSLVSNLLMERIALYSSQLCVAFGFLVQLIEKQHQLNAPIYNCKKYICDRMCWCFQKIIEVLDSSNPSQEEEHFEQENHFVYRMDLVLDVISGMSSKSQQEQVDECTELWLGIEDVFSHAMAIAQVCHPYNFKAITGVCQSIMSEYENLKTQLLSEKPDPTMNNLFMNTLNDALYRLERKVNVSVLTLVMEVFSDPFGALKKLIKCCGNSLSAKKRSKADLNNAIEDFDQVTDKMMQIGMFAIACCGDITRVNKIRSCLASLETLETELVPAIVSFYLNPEDNEMRSSLALLIAQWQVEINKLHNTVDVIIDSAAYCQVILDDLQERVTIMSDCLDNREGVTQQQVQGVVQKASSLSSQVSATVKDIGDGIDRQTIMMIRELKAAIIEADAASKQFLTDNATEPQQLRVIKRCELILNVVKRLQPALVVIMNNSILMNTNYGKAGIGQGDSLHDSSISFPSSIYGLPRDEKTISYIRTPYTVKNYKPPLSIQPANSVPRTESDMSCLIPYIKKGHTIRTERSIMYKTPRNTEAHDQSLTKNELKMRNLFNVRQHLFSRDSFTFQREIDLTTESLDLSDFLKRATCLTATLSPSISNSNTPKAQNTLRESTGDGKNVSDISIDLSENVSVAQEDPRLSKYNDSVSPQKVDECSTIGGGDAPSAIETPERVEDIQRLDKKIAIIQKQLCTE